MNEAVSAQVRTHITLEKVDVSGDVPVLVETLEITEDEHGRVVTRTPGPAGG